MRIEIWGEKEKQEEVLRVRAAVDHDGDFCVAAVSEKGRDLSAGTILYLRSCDDGKIRLVRMMGCCAPGVAVDSEGRIELTGE